MKPRAFFMAVALCAAASFGAAQPPAPPVQDGVSTDATPALTFALSSDAVLDGNLLNQQFTCDGAGESPPLSWKNAPAGTKSFALTMHHYPPAGEDKHVYLVVYALPATLDHLEAGTTLGRWGSNTVNRKAVYTPPCSQGPGRKEYILTVYALSQAPVFAGAGGAVTMDDLLEAVQDTTLATATLTVGYVRPDGK